MENNQKIILFLVLALIATIAIFGYYIYQQRQSINSQNLAQNMQCKTLANQFYQIQRARQERINTAPADIIEPTLHSSYGTPYYKYSSKLDACIYLIYSVRSNQESNFEIFDITHEDDPNPLADYFTPFQAELTPENQEYVAAMRTQNKQFCNVFNNLFSDEITNYRNLGITKNLIAENYLLVGEPLMVTLADKCNGKSSL